MVVLIIVLTYLFIFVTPVGATGLPKLVLQITVDGLRGDLPQRYGKILGKDGFRYLMDQGIYYTNAHYQHANTETIVGHTSLATGSVPAAHGMVANVWFDREQGRLVYNIEDPSYHLLTAGADVDKKMEIDPTQKAAKVEGRSPNNILTSTLSDEMAVHFAGRSKIFAVSVKDRGAVSMAGHAGKAFWFSKKSAEFVTSNYYYKQYPDWVNKWNERQPALAYAGKAWELLHPATEYLFGNADDREYETYFPGFGRTFPHAYGLADDKYFTTRLTLSPAGDELTLDFAKALIDNEQLGQDQVPDYLAISFSSTDYVGHIFGASSLESEDNLARLDRTLANLFAFIDKKIGLDNTLIVLSADHGQPEVPGHLHERGIDKAHYFDTRNLDKAPAIAALKKQFGIGEELIESYFHPYLYLNHELIRAKGLDQAKVEKAVAAELLKFKGVAYAVSSTALRTGSLADTPLTRSILRNFHPKRSGDIYLVFEPNVFINDFYGLIVASTHGSPWRYDTYVPVMFAGAGLKAAKVNRAVTPYDIAATLAAYLNMKSPSGTVGTPLVEVTGSSTGLASEHGEQAKSTRNRFSFGVGAGLVRFDTNFRFTDKESNLSVFVDGEGTLGLPEKNNITVFYGTYRFNKRHGIGFSHFRVKREATLFQFNESKDFHLGDLTITAGANASVTLSDKSSFYYLTYNYTIFDDSRSYLLASFGLYGLDLSYGLDARGEITLQGIPVIEERYTAEASVFAPLPMFGMDAWYFFTPKWALGTKISLVTGSYQDISAVVMDTSVRAKYQFAKHVGFTFGVTYFNGEVTIDEADLRTEVDYGYDGVALGLDIRF